MQGFYKEGINIVKKSINGSLLSIKITFVKINSYQLAKQIHLEK